MSVGSYGCNLRCPFCQNARIATARKEDVPTKFLSPQALAETSYALAGKGNLGVAFTYNEPMVGYEYIRDTAKLVKAQGQKNVVVTNGSVAPFALEEVLPYVHAFNIDVKGFTPEYYRWLGGDLQTVKDFVALAVTAAHVEITTLIVPEKNDSPEEMRALAQWLSSFSPDIPLHLSRFFPAHRFTNTSPTPVEKLYALQAIAKTYLSTVLVGNV